MWFLLVESNNFGFSRHILYCQVDLLFYVEDCEVCCNPIELTFSVENYEGETTVTSFDAAQLGQ